MKMINVANMPKIIVVLCLLCDVMVLLCNSRPSEVTRPKADSSRRAPSLTTVVSVMPFTALARTFTGTDAFTFVDYWKFARLPVDLA